ncbi:uncharacterized protein [Eurosta solidaginis]|uniref:uncharacterized protein n=1 Tax=Eurosta solidaginis TaxID=178769 RepID=UPI0035306AF9
MTRRAKLVVNKMKKDTMYFRKDPEAPQASKQKCPNNTSTFNQPTNYGRVAQPAKLTLAQKFEFVLTLINRFLIGFITVYLCWMSLRLDLEDITWHALFCTLGFLCLMSEGLIAYYNGNIWTQVCPRPEKARLHWVLQIFGSVIGLAGVVIKIFLEDVHFQTRHGIVGLATTIILLISLLSGLISLYAAELKSRLQPRFNKTLHNIIGLTTFTLAMLSMYYSFDTDLFNVYSIDTASFNDFRLLMKIIIIVIYVLSVYGPLWCLFYSRI